MDKTCVVINEDLEKYMTERYPVGSKWIHPRMDIEFVIVSHNRQDKTPTWFVSGPVQFLEPTCTVYDVSYPEETEVFDLGVLAMFVKPGHMAFELNRQQNPDLTAVASST